MFFKFISYLPAIFGLLSIGLFVYLNNPKKLKNRVFALLNVFIALWLLALFAADTTKSITVALWSLRTAGLMSACMFLFFYYFSLVFPFSSKINKHREIIYSLPMFVIALTSFTPLQVASVSIHDFGVQPDKIGPFYTALDIAGIIYLLLGIAILLRKYKKSETSEKNQIKFMLFGLSTAIVANVFTGFVLTLLKVNTDAIFFGAFSLFIFSLFVAFAIVKHRLFDVRFVVVRALGYLLSLGTIILITALVIFGLSNQLVARGVSQDVRLWFYVVLTILFSVTYQPLKRIFDALTIKLFYRDAYTTRDLLDDFNKAIVSTIDLKELLRRSSDVISEYIKPESIAVAVRDKKDEISIISDNNTGLDRQPLELIRKYLHSNEQKLIITDTLEDKDSGLQKVLQKAKIGLVTRITADTKLEGNGYLFLGYKKSGNMYNNQDTAVLNILTNELNIAMQNALQFDEIQKFNQTLQEKIEIATHQLRRTNEKLKALDETKDEFISMASHQLRTPLTSVKGYLSMVLEGDAGKVPKTQRKLLDQAYISSQRMVYLIADLLNVSRLRTGKFVIETNPANLADVVEGEVEQLKETADARKLTLEYEKPKDFPTLPMDETKIRQVIMNFMDNAIYYTPSGGHITVDVKEDSKSVTYTVSDNGMGVPKSEQHHLFSKFYRAGNAKKARPDGTGLGLFMAKKVIIAQGGSLIFNSQEGKGSTFGFTFAKSKLQALAQPLSTEKPLSK